jgi:hypothetical protein
MPEISTKIKLSTKDIIGILIVVVGLLLLLYSFMIANDCVRSEFTVDETFGVKIAFLICMIGIGGYLAGKGAVLTENSRIVGIILTPVGLFMLCFSFIVAKTIAGGEFIFSGEELQGLPMRTVFFLCMSGIGGYVTEKGVILTNYPKITGSILTPIGVIMLLFSFTMANEFVSGEFSMAKETLAFVIRIIFFVCMIGVGAYLTGRGASEIMKK